MTGVLWRLGQLEDITENHQVGFAACRGHQVGLRQPLLVSLVSGVFEELGMFDVEPTPGLTEAESLVGPGAEDEQGVLLQSVGLPLGSLASAQEKG